jgi:Zn-dependent oligopeptidase
MGIFTLFLPQKERTSSRATTKTFEPPTQNIQAMDTQAYLASDEKEWLRYLSQPLRTYRKPGVTLPDEHKQWLAARAQSRALVAAASSRMARTN